MFHPTDSSDRHCLGVENAETGEQLPRRQPLYVTPDASGTKTNVKEFVNSAKLESSVWDWMILAASETYQLRKMAIGKSANRWISRS